MSMKKLMAAIMVAASATLAALADNQSILLNGSFESYVAGANDAFTNTQLHAGMNGTRHPNNWAYTGNAGLCASGDDPFLGGGDVPDGVIAVYLQNSGTISQPITVTDAGTYEVSFRYASRGGIYTNGCIFVKIADSGNVETTLGRFDCPVTAFRTAYVKTYLAAGTYTLNLEHAKASSSGSGDSVIDRVEMKLMDNLVSNGSFEDYRNETGDFKTYKTLVANTFLPEDWSWTKGSGNVGLTKSYSGNPFVQDDFPDGNIVLYLQKASSISQTFIAATTGIHKVTFRYAGRGGYLKGRLHAKIDGNSLGYADCQTNLYHTICMETNLVAGTSYTLTIEQDVANNANANSTIDLVSVTPSDNLIFNGNFDNGSTGGNIYRIRTGSGYYNPHWSVTGNVGLSMANTTWTGTLSLGVYAAYLQTSSSATTLSLTQTFTADRPGVYALSFSHAKRNAERVDPEVRVRVYSGAGTSGAVVSQKTVVSSLVAADGAYGSFVTEVKIPEAGEYTIEFYREVQYNSSNVAQDTATILDNVSLTYDRKIRKGIVITVR